MFIELTQQDGNSILINAASIISVEKQGDGSLLHLHDPERKGFAVQEPYHEIKRILRED